MKTQLLLWGALCLMNVLQAQNVRVSVQDGLALNPFVWNCTCIPLPGDSIVINHQITLNNDFAYLSGAVLIQPSGKLIGDIPSRIFASAAYFENRGVFQVGRVAFTNGKAFNSGHFEADSLFTGIQSGGEFANTGTVEIHTSFLNTGRFSVANGAEMVVRDYFLNGDSLAPGNTALFVNDGAVRVNLDFGNADSIRGNGQFCIDGGTYNIGVITGNLDFCDLSGGGIDYNGGVVGGNVQLCQQPCLVGIENEIHPSLTVYPNPAIEHIRFQTGSEAIISVWDVHGKIYHHASGIQAGIILDIKDWKPGIYFYQVQEKGNVFTGKFIKQG